MMVNELVKFADYLALHPALWGIESFYCTYKFDQPMECIHTYLQFLTVTQKDDTLFSNLDVFGDIWERRKREELPLFESRGIRATKLLETFKDDCNFFAKKKGWSVNDDGSTLGIRALQVCNPNVAHMLEPGIKRSREDDHQDGPRKKPKKITHLV